MGSEVDITRYFSELAARIWVPQAIEDTVAVPWVPVLVLGLLGAVLLWRAYWTLHRSTAIPVVRVFVLMGYVLVTWLLVDVTAALWQVQKPSDVIRAAQVALALRVAGLCPGGADGDRLGRQGLSAPVQGEEDRVSGGQNIAS